MKKYVISIICTMMILSLAGCQSGESNSSAEIASDTNTKQESTSPSTVTLELATQEGSAPEVTTVEASTTETLTQAIGNQKPVIDYDLTAELQQVEEQEDVLEEQFHTIEFITQTDMNLLSFDIYTLWDDELNLIWGRLQEVLSKEEMQKLTEEELEWIAYKEAEADVIAEECMGGSITPLLVNGRMAELTRERVYELAGCLGEKIGQEVPALLPEDFSGTYVDRQGTDSVFSELEIVPADNGTYAVTIGLYRITTLEGVAVSDGNKLLYEDNDFQIKGEIRIQGEEASLYITESDFEYISPGYSVVFSEME